MGALAAWAAASEGYARAVQRDEQALEVEAPNNQPDRRHQHVVHERGDDLAERRAEDHADRQVEDTAARRELAKFLPHKLLLRVGRRVSVPEID